MYFFMHLLIITMVSIEQTMEIAEDANSQTSCFDEESKTRAWLAD